MGSKQINFYALPEEIYPLQDWLIKRDVLFIKQPINSATELFDKTNSAPNGSKEWFKLYLTLPEYKDHVFVEYNDQQGYYSIEEFSSWVIEFSRPIFYKGSGLSRARLFYITGYYQEDGTFLKRDPAFAKWADSLIKNFKKELLIKFKTEQADYATRGFMENFDASIRLTL